MLQSRTKVYWHSGIETILWPRGERSWQRVTDWQTKQTLTCWFWLGIKYEALFVIEQVKIRWTIFFQLCQIYTSRLKIISPTGSGNAITLFTWIWCAINFVLVTWIMNAWMRNSFTFFISCYISGWIENKIKMKLKFLRK